MARSKSEGLVEKAEKLKALHRPGNPLVLANVWDVATARVVEEAGAEAIATTSAGVAFASGYPDGERIPRDRMLAAIATVCSSVSVPVTADVEAGYGPTPQDVRVTVRGVLDAGAVGINLEDGGAPGTLVDLPRQIEKVRAAREEADRRGVPLVLNARTDAFHPGALPPDRQFAEAVRRGNAYRAAGADCVFVPFVGDSGTIERLVKEIAAPLNILGAPDAPSLTSLEALGVRRVTFGSAPMRATLGLVRRMAKEWKEKGTYGTLAAYGIPFKELQQLFG